MDNLKLIVILSIKKLVSNEKKHCLSINDKK